MSPHRLSFLVSLSVVLSHRLRGYDTALESSVQGKTALKCVSRATDLSKVSKCGKMHVMGRAGGVDTRKTRSGEVRLNLWLPEGQYRVLEDHAAQESRSV